MGVEIKGLVSISIGVNIVIWRMENESGTIRRTNVESTVKRAL
jgi:hypothetical protein